MIEIKWDDTDTKTGTKRYISAGKFGGSWLFKSRLARRGDWTTGLKPDLDMWETLLDALERRYQRDEVPYEDVVAVRKIVVAERGRLALDEEE